MNVVDSSGWLEFFGDGRNAEFFSTPLSDAPSLIVPVITVYEVFKRVLLDRGEGAALEAVALMQQGEVVELTSASAIEAARLSVEASLPMADAIILSMARARGATFWTQDAHFEGVADVKYVSARSD
ncbi:MAG: type II toxin-antitoxin system VapC family toxin [Actinobacteria bacterium]|nr:type II toxin-antitoxin system VapC family toxin [Actinomycetota bacterium]MCG2807032.1 type II toxin-antitoxin system VapC family toxin [Coriobacteriia bacterium]